MSKARTETTTHNDPLKPSASLLCKLASMVVHADELSSFQGHSFDAAALRQVVNDPEVAAWIAEMSKNGMVPIKRTMDDLRLAAKRTADGER